MAMVPIRCWQYYGMRGWQYYGNGGNIKAMVLMRGGQYYGNGSNERLAISGNGGNIMAMVLMNGGGQCEREEVAPSGHVTTMMPRTQ